MGRLGPLEADTRRACKILLELITGTDGSGELMDLASAAAQLNLTKEEKSSIRKTVLMSISTSHIPVGIKYLAGTLIKLDLTPEDERDVREALLARICHGPDLPTSKILRTMHADEIPSQVALLHPTVRDLSTWRTWTVQPSGELVSAVRHSSTLGDWLSALPDLSEITRQKLNKHWGNFAVAMGAGLG
jgi:hypothetical protein